MRATLLVLFPLFSASLLPLQYPQRGGVKPSCNSEPVMSNLLVKKNTQVTGRLRTFEGDEVRNSYIELRRYKSPFEQPSVENVMTDEEGGFDLGPVNAGQYRLLASPTSRYEEPRSLVCSSDAPCLLDITLMSKIEPVDPNCPRR